MSNAYVFTFLFLAVFGFHYACGTEECPCPKWLDSPDEKYCCPTNSDGVYRCCTSGEYYSKMTLGFGILLIPILILTCIIGCVCCACRSILRGLRPNNSGAVYMNQPLPIRSY